MRRALPIAIASLSVIALLAWALWPAPEPPIVVAEGRGEAASDGPEAPLSPPKLQGARVAGVVMREGQPVARARVSLRATVPLVTLTMDDGRFLFEDVPSGAVYLAASSGEAASDVLGPLQLLPQGRLEELVLTLQPAVKVEGRVIDLLTRGPIAGATVVSPTQALQTDAQGRFSLRGARTQSWIELSAPGFLSRTEWVSLELAAAGGRLEIVLTPASRLEGTVTEAGTPVPACTVWAEQLEGARRGERSLTTFTDKEGRFVLEVPAGALALSAVTPQGTRVKGPQVRVAVGETVKDLVLESGVVTSAHGVVTRGGLPVPGAQVSAIDAASEDVSALATTQLDGAFRFDALVAGRYVLQVRLGRLTMIAGPFTQPGDGWNVALPEGRALRGRVEPAGPGVRVRWRSGTWSGPSAEAETGADGRFEFEGLPQEWVSVDAQGAAGAATARAQPGDELVLRLQKGQLVVRMRDDAGGAVTDGLLIARNLETGASRRQLVLAPDGVARLDLPAGTWSVSFEVSGRGRSPEVAVRVPPEGAEVSLTLAETLVVSGAVIDAATRLPLQGVRIDASSGDPGKGSRVSVLTDARGQFLLPSVPRAGYLIASRPGYGRQWRRVADSARWELALQATADPNAARADLEQFEGVGMVLDARTGSVLVAQVNEGSPAERAGVMPQDQILAVDGAPIAGLRIEQVIQRIRGPAGTPVTIRFQRAGQAFDLTLRRRLLTL